MKVIRNLSMRNKLLVLLLPAMLVLLIVFVERLQDYWQQYRLMQRMQQEVERLGLLDPVISELQRERGRTAVFLAAGGGSSAAGSALQAQHQQTDAAIRQWQTGQGTSPSSMAQELSPLWQVMQNLDDLRRRVQSAELSAEDATARYTDMIRIAMTLVVQTLQAAQVQDIPRRLSAYAAIANMAEMAGRERASGSAYLKKGQFDAGTLLPVVQLHGQQDSWQQAVGLFLSADELNFWQRTLDSAENTGFIKLREQLQRDPFRTAIAPELWFQESTARIDKLNSGKAHLLQDIVVQAQALQSSAYTNLWLEGLALLVVLLMVLGISASISTQLQRQVSCLLAAIRTAMQNKDLSVSVRTDSHDELGELSAAVQELFQVFADALNKIDNASLQLAAAMEETAATAGKNAHNLEHQQQQVEQVATASEELSATAGQISRNTLQVAEAAVSVRNRSERGESTVSLSVNHIQRLAGSVQGVDQLMQDLQQRSASMIQVIDVIRNVAEQTNLLALNAAIEAARAGEHGRGFAVVADEVRALAQQTHASTQQIQSIIESFTGLSASASESIENSHRIADETIQQADNLEHTFAEILQEVKQISDMAAEIATASEEQVAVSREVARSMEIIRDDAAQTSQGAQEIRSVTSDQALLANELKALAAEFRTG